MDKKIVTVERTYDAPIQQVWDALTNKEQMKQWYFDVTDFKPEVGFTFQFTGENEGKTFLHNCTVVEANPITRLAYTWSYEGYTGQSLVTFELSDINPHTTRLKLTHSGLDTFPQDQPDFSHNNFSEGWKSLIGDSLRMVVETGHITQSIRIHASLKDIWNIVLHPDHQWGLAFGGGATAETDWKEGSPIIWRDNQNNIGANGIVEVHQPESFLQLHYYDDVHPQPGAQPGAYYEKISVTADNDASLLTIYAGKIERKHIPEHTRMWDEALTMIKDLAEKK